MSWLSDAFFCVKGQGMVVLAYAAVLLSGTSAGCVLPVSSGLSGEVNLIPQRNVRLCHEGEVSFAHRQCC